jgi:hypothetical protein
MDLTAMILPSVRYADNLVEKSSPRRPLRVLRSLEAANNIVKSLKSVGLAARE